MSKGDWPTAIEIWRRLADDPALPIAPKILLQLAVCHREAGDFDAAEDALDQARSRDPRHHRVALEWAQLPMFRSDWSSATERWLELIEGSEGSPTPDVLMRLAVCYREQGDHQAAEEVLEKGRSLYPNHDALALEWAQQPSTADDWSESIRRWQSLLDARGDGAGPTLFAKLASAYRHARRFGMAEAILHEGERRHPRGKSLAVERAELAMAREDWDEAVVRWRAIIEFDPDCGAQVYRKLAASYREQGDYLAATERLEDGRSRFPDASPLYLEAAQLAMVQGDWERATSRWQHLVDVHGAETPALIYSRLATEHRQVGRFDLAASVLSQGRHRHPRDAQLVEDEAHLAMTRRDWATAIAWWEHLLSMRVAELEEQTDRAPELPTQAPNSDWNEAHWAALARWWTTGDGPVEQPSVAIYRSVADVLGRLGEADLRRAVIEMGRRAYPDDRALAFEAFDDASLPTDAQVHGERNDRVLASFASDPCDELPRLHRIRVPYGSSLHTHVVHGRYYDAARMRREIRRLSEHEAWPESGAGPNPLLHMARRLADEYGRRFETPPYLPAETLAEAVLFLLHTELWTYEPIRRLARAIAAEDDDSPVYVELAPGVLHYLGGYRDSELAPLYLYAELRRRGVNAFLARIEPHRTAEQGFWPAPLQIRPSPYLMQARVPQTEPPAGRYRAGIVPAGMRSPEAVTGALDEGLLYASGYLTQRFAYDRSLRRWIPLEPDVSLHPPRNLLRSTRIDFVRVERLAGTDLIADGRGGAQGHVEVSAPLGGDWLSWMHRFLGGYLLDMSRRCHGEVALRGVEEAHIADIHYAESALFAGAVKAAGGRVVLWPHSANPADHEVRRTGSFDVVHAVTRTGCEAWRARFPDVEVIHTPSAMLSPPSENAVVDGDQPLSVIVIGGKSIQGYMPFINEARHEESYRRFFAGLERLQREHAIDVYYKAKGGFGENDAWLERVVGHTANWRRVLEHPLRIDLPNMLFVSVSVGTSALLEGLSRGVPCVVVRDFPVRDYTTISPGAIPIAPTDDALRYIQACASGGLRELVARQTEYYLREIGEPRRGVETLDPPAEHDPDRAQEDLEVEHR